MTRRFIDPYRSFEALLFLAKHPKSKLDLDWIGHTKKNKTVSWRDKIFYGDAK